MQLTAGRRLAAISFALLSPRPVGSIFVSARPWMQRHAHPICSSAWSAKTVVELKAALKERGLKVSGKKAELIERLGDAPASDAGC